MQRDPSCFAIHFVFVEKRSKKYRSSNFKQIVRDV